MGVDAKFLPSSLRDDSDIDLPPPIPPKLFLSEELFPPSPKHMEGEEPYSTAPTQSKPGR